MDYLSFSLLLLCFLIWPVLKNSFYKINTSFIKFVNILTILIIFLFFISKSLFFIFTFFEIVLIPIIIIIIGWGYQVERLTASSYLLMYTIIFSFPFFSVIIYIFLVNKNTFIFSYILINFGAITIFIFFPFFVKLPIILVHF